MYLHCLFMKLTATESVVPMLQKAFCFIYFLITYSFYFCFKLSSTIFILHDILLSDHCVACSLLSCTCSDFKCTPSTLGGRLRWIQKLQIVPNQHNIFLLHLTSLITDDNISLMTIQWWFDDFGDVETSSYGITNCFTGKGLIL